MTTIHKVDLSLIGEFGPEQDKILIRGSATAAREQNAAVFIYEKCRFWGDDADEPLAAIIPAELARELVREGRLAPPPIASMTVLARDAGKPEGQEL